MASQPGSPSTPPRPGHSRTTSMPSPMSLHRLGITSPLSSFRRQFISSPQHSHLELPHITELNPGDPAMRTDDEDSASSAEPSDEDRTEDSKDVLVERLNDLAQRLAQGRSRSADIAAMHVYVDKLEEHLPRPVYALARPRTGSSRQQSFVVADENRQDEHVWGPPLSPSFVLRSRFASMSDLGTGSLPTPPEGRRPQLRQRNSANKSRHEPLRPEPSVTGPSILGPLSPEPPRPEPVRSGPSPDQARQVADEAERLREEIAAAHEGLRQRRLESDWVEDVFIGKMKELKGQLMDLCKQVAQLQFDLSNMQEDLQDQESELYHMRIHVKSIEILSQGKGANDAQLLEGIRNWFSDYRALQRKWELKRQKRSSTSMSTYTTASTPPPYRSPPLPFPPPESPQPGSSPPPPVTARKIGPRGLGGASGASGS